MVQERAEFIDVQKRYIELFLARSPALADLRKYEELYVRTREVVNAAVSELTPAAVSGAEISRLAHIEQDVLAMRLLRDAAFRTYLEREAPEQILTIADGIAYKVSEAHRHFLQQRVPSPDNEVLPH